MHLRAPAGPIRLDGPAAANVPQTLCRAARYSGAETRSLAPPPFAPNDGGRSVHFESAAHGDCFSTTGTCFPLRSLQGWCFSGGSTLLEPRNNRSEAVRSHEGTCRRPCGSAATSLPAAARLVSRCGLIFHGLPGSARCVVDLRQTLVTVNRSHYSPAKVQDPGCEASTTVGSKTRAPAETAPPSRTTNERSCPLCDCCHYLVGFEFSLLQPSGGDRP
jgi:hypothetical protein